MHPLLAKMFTIKADPLQGATPPPFDPEAGQPNNMTFGDARDAEPGMYEVLLDYTNPEKRWVVHVKADGSRNCLGYVSAEDVPDLIQFYETEQMKAEDKATFGTVAIVIAVAIGTLAMIGLLISGALTSVPGRLGG